MPEEFISLTIPIQQHVDIFQTSQHLGHSQIDGTLMEDVSAKIDINDRYTVQVIADGHGGTDFFAKRCVDSFIRILTETITTRSITEALLHQVISITQQMVDREASDSFIINGGSTFAFSIVDRLESKAYIGNMGDSPVFVFSKKENGQYAIRYRTEDHDHNNVGEHLRLQEIGLGARFYGEYMHYYNNRLMVSRGFGDYNMGANMGRHADITVLDLQPDDIILCCTDGLLEQLRIVRRKMNIGPGRNECELENDLNSALAGGHVIGEFMIERKLDQMVSTYLQLAQVEYTPELANEWRTKLANSMDNIMVCVHKHESSLENVDTDSSSIDQIVITFEI